MKDTLNRLLRNQDGLETVEYAVMSGLIVAGILLAVTNIGQWILTRFQTVLTILGP